MHKKGGAPLNLILPNEAATWDRVFFHAIVKASGDSGGTWSFAASLAPVALLAVPLLQVLAGDGQRSRRCNRRNEVRQCARSSRVARRASACRAGMLTSAPPQGPRSHRW